VSRGTGFILGRRIDCLHRLKGVPPVECPSRAMPGMLELSTVKYATDSDLENVSKSIEPNTIQDMNYLATGKIR
jgi:hypothetical protein